MHALLNLFHTVQGQSLAQTGQNLCRVFHSRLGRACIGHAIVNIAKQPNLKLKTWPKKLLGLVLLGFALPVLA
jgi:hypothetical protein